jgi:hypothetical protein
MAEVTAQTYVKRAVDDLSWRVVDNEAIIVRPDDGASYVLNPVGTTVWELANGERTLVEIVRAVCTTYEVTPDRALRDIVEWVDWMQARKLVGLY